VRDLTADVDGDGVGPTDLRVRWQQREVSVAADGGGFAARLERARAGDACAWSELYHAIAPVIIGYLRAQRLPDPEDVAGEVLLEVVRDLHRFEGDEAGFRSWSLAIAHHRLLDARRRDQRRPSTPTAPNELSPPPALDDPERDALAAMGFGSLEPALRDLTEDQRSVLLLRVIGDLSIAEVARITGKRQGAVKQLQRRAADAMRRTLEAPTPAASGRALPAERTRPSALRTSSDVSGLDDASPAGWTS
jgi:RNA polymerase sigma factor (sigma-70 family)